MNIFPKLRLHLTKKYTNIYKVTECELSIASSQTSMPMMVALVPAATIPTLNFASQAALAFIHGDKEVSFRL